MSFQPCAVIPVFNHHACLERVVDALRELTLPVLLVDDGSAEPTRHVIAQLAERDGVDCLSMGRNQGKGAAVMAGIAKAGANGHTHVLQVDADGQHDLADAGHMLELAAAHPGSLVSGCPRYDDSVPAVRFYGRYLTHALVWLETLSLSLRDSMCGFRVYPVLPCLALAKKARIGRRMDFDTDLMVRLYWAGTACLFVPTCVNYPADGTSNFRMLRDNARMAWLHVRLCLGMLVRVPRLLRLRRQTARAPTFTEPGR